MIYVQEPVSEALVIRRDFTLDKYLDQAPAVSGLRSGRLFARSGK